MIATYARKKIDISWSDIISILWTAFHTFFKTFTKITTTTTTTIVTPSQTSSQSPSHQTTTLLPSSPWSPSSALTTLTTLTVRSGFDLCLHSLSLPPGSEILISAITIPDMIRIIQAHGLIPIAIDVQPDGTVSASDVYALITPRTRAVLIAHLFGGRMEGFEEIVEVVRRAEGERGGEDDAGGERIVIFEDCAEAFAGREYVGCEGADVSMFSFGLIKTCTAFGGGILMIWDPILRADVARLQALYPRQKESAFVLKVVKCAVFKALTDSLWAYGIFLILVERVLRMDHHVLIRKLSRSFEPSTLLVKIKYQPSFLLQTLLRRRIERFDEEILKRRRQRVNRIFELLALEKVRPIGFDLRDHHYWLCPVRVEDPEVFARVLYERGYDCADGGTSLAVVGEGQSVRAREMMKKVVYLPIDYEMRDVEVLRLVTVLRGVLRVC